MLRSIKQTVLFIAAVQVLAACQGKNPFDRSNDPTKDFGNLKQDSGSYQTLENTELERYKDSQLPQMETMRNDLIKARHELEALKAEKSNVQSTCGRVYDMSIEGTEGGRLDFIENTEKTYKIKVRSYLTNKFSLKLEKAPDSSVRISSTDKAGEFNLTWKPGSDLISERESFYTGPLKIAFVPLAAQANVQTCLNSKFVQDFSVTVALDAAQPVLTVNELAKSAYASKEEQVLVQLTVTDPAASSNLPPQVFPVNSDESGARVTSLISSCFAPKAANTAKTWTVDCLVFLSPLKKQIDAAKNGEKLEGRVAFKAVSQRNGRQTPSVVKLINVVVDEPSKVLEPIDGVEVTKYQNGEVPVPTWRPKQQLPKIDPDMADATGEIPVPARRPTE